MSQPSLSVVVVTYERAAYLRRCLESLVVDRDHIDEVVVVDASAESCADTVSGIELPLAFVHAPELAGWMTRSRNQGLLHVTGDVVAFLDDDVVIHPGWAAGLRDLYASTQAVAAAGCTRNGISGEEFYDKPIGRLLASGKLTEGFASSVAHPVPIDHGIGANMSFRRDMLGVLGGFRDDYPGTALREDTDIFLRIQKLGGLALFTPRAVVDHKPAPHFHGRRFDTRYKLYGRRNHMVLLARHEGVRSPLLRRWVVSQILEALGVRGVRRKIEKCGIVAVGLAFGSAAIIRDGHWRAMDPIRRDAAGVSIRSALGVTTPNPRLRLQMSTTESVGPGGE